VQPFKMKIISRPYHEGGPPVLGRTEVEVEVDGERVDLKDLDQIVVSVDTRAAVPFVTMTFSPPPGSQIEIDAVAADVTRKWK